MTNPIKFLFESLGFLNYETEILEACDWDEERSEFVKEEFQKALAVPEIIEESDVQNPLSGIKSKLSKRLSEKEAAVCLRILEECIDNFSYKGDTSYEN